MHESRDRLVTRIRQAAADCGYIDCGITTADPFDNYAEALNRRCRQFPEASTLYKPMHNRVDPRRTAPWANSIVVCVRNYGKYRLPPELPRHIGRNYLADRRLADCPDHEMPRQMTEALRKMGFRVKRGGIPERAAGRRAGVVGIGRNGFAYHPRAGSWINLESWRLDLALPADQANRDCPCPPDCRACIEACPTKALQKPFVMRMDHCVAYLTYSAQWPVPTRLWQAMGPWIYGCDDCQLSCPLNHGRWRREEPMPWLETRLEQLTPAALAVMDQETYLNEVLPWFWYLREAGAERWRANARRALAQGRYHDPAPEPDGRTESTARIPGKNLSNRHPKPGRPAN